MKRAALKLKQAGRLHNCMHKNPSLFRAVRLPSPRPVKILTNWHGPCRISLPLLGHTLQSAVSSPAPSSSWPGLGLGACYHQGFFSSPVYSREHPSPYHVHWEASTTSVPERATQPGPIPAPKLQDARRLQGQPGMALSSHPERLPCDRQPSLSVGQTALKR